jgi:alkylhydroperoxidase family enzyme
MRDESSVLDQKLKRQCALVASKVNGCKYCTTHHCTIVKRPVSGVDEGWGLDQEEVEALLNQKYQPEDEKQRACLDFVAAASQDPGAVADDIYARLKQYLTPAEIMELASLVGFWKMYNTIHDSLRIPIEPGLIAESQTVGL